MFTATFIIAKKLEANQVSINRMYKENVVCMYNGLLYRPKKEENTATCDSMDGPCRHYGK